MYIQCTFCIMDWSVNFNSELKSIFKKLLKLLKLNPKLGDLILSRCKIVLSYVAKYKEDLRLGMKG